MLCHERFNEASLPAGIAAAGYHHVRYFLSRYNWTCSTTGFCNLSISEFTEKCQQLLVDFIREDLQDPDAVGTRHIGQDLKAA